MNPAVMTTALQDVRVIDLTTVIFGPYATQTLADYGADVIKIEAPGGDSTRHSGATREPGMGSLFLGANRNKRSVVLDLKQPAARQALLALVDEADVFIHNVRPQKLARLGLGEQALRARNPRLIYVGLHGFGSDGPYAGAPAYDDVVQALSGAADLVARQSGEAGYFPTVAADKVSAHVAVHAVLAALFQRERSGRGQFVEVPMFECMASFLLVEHFYARHLVDGAAGAAADPAPGPVPRDSLGYPRAVDPWRRPYRTRDGHVCLMPYTDLHWQRFFDAVGQRELADDARFVDITQRTRHVAALLKIVAGLVQHRDSAHWLALCRQLDIPCAPVRRLEELEHDPHLLAVDFFTAVEGAGGRPYRFTRPPMRLSDSTSTLTAPPRLGQHTAEVLARLPLPPEVMAELLAPQAAGA